MDVAGRQKFDDKIACTQQTKNMLYGTKKLISSNHIIMTNKFMLI